MELGKGGRRWKYYRFKRVKMNMKNQSGKENEIFFFNRKKCFQQEVMVQNKVK